MIQYTNRSLKWEILQSWWMIFVFVPFGFVSFIAFLYAGLKVRKFKWVIYAVFYFFVCLFFPFNMSGQSDTYINIIMVTDMVMWIVSIIGAARIRPVFLRLLAIREDERRYQLQQQYPSPTYSNTQDSQPNDPYDPYRDLQQPINKTWSSEANSPAYAAPAGGIHLYKDTRLHINTATEAQLAAMPQIGTILAQTIIAKRNEIGQFDSMQHFAQELNLPLHLVERLEPHLQFHSSSYR
ncbi:ComEA family DNA-binding protein [Paenibacillus kandeliae]|uniref:ComEA family DNA-binding protein n=1 Tax=Paenibacillus kandeliae TaxID=3231269 RepID=UPI0034575030